LRGDCRVNSIFGKYTMSLRIIATGGTFDKHYDAVKGALGFGKTHLPQVLAQARITLPITVQELMQLDSLDMQDADRARILQACAEAREDRIVIIHGTDTMRETAEVLGNARVAKTIVLTGAMVPYEIAESDALFNVGVAVGAAQQLAHGVYIAMNGQIFSWDNVMKDRAAGRFTQR
jgi:L-asparaginase